MGKCTALINETSIIQLRQWVQEQHFLEGVHSSFKVSIFGWEIPLKKKNIDLEKKAQQIKKTKQQQND